MSHTIPPTSEIEGDLDALADLFDLGKDRLGEFLCDLAAEGVMANMVAECDPDGVPWAPLNPAYAAQKELITPGAPMGVLFGIMRTSEEICGMREIEADHAEMGYGVSDLARIEAVKFQEGGAVTGTKQPPRKFYGLTEGAIIASSEALDQHFSSFKPRP